MISQAKSAFIKKEKQSEESNSSMLMGSPLKDDCEMDMIDDSFELNGPICNSWTKEEECFGAIDFKYVQ